MTDNMTNNLKKYKDFQKEDKAIEKMLDYIIKYLELLSSHTGFYNDKFN